MRRKSEPLSERWWSRAALRFARVLRIPPQITQRLIPCNLLQSPEAEFNFYKAMPISGPRQVRARGLSHNRWLVEELALNELP